MFESSFYILRWLLPRNYKIQLWVCAIIFFINLEEWEFWNQEAQKKFLAQENRTHDSPSSSSDALSTELLEVLWRAGSEFNIITTPVILTQPVVRLLGYGNGKYKSFPFPNRASFFTLAGRWSWRLEQFDWFAILDYDVDVLQLALFCRLSFMVRAFSEAPPSKGEEKMQFLITNHDGKVELWKQ